MRVNLRRVCPLEEGSEPDAAHALRVGGGSGGRGLIPPDMFVDDRCWRWAIGYCGDFWYQRLPDLWIWWFWSIGCDWSFLCCCMQPRYYGETSLESYFQLFVHTGWQLLEFNKMQYEAPTLGWVSEYYVIWQGSLKRDLIWVCWLPFYLPFSSGCFLRESLSWVQWLRFPQPYPFLHLKFTKLVSIKLLERIFTSVSACCKLQL